MSGLVKPGEVRVCGVSRHFTVTRDQPATLKERLIRRGGEQRPSELTAVRDVSFRINAGESVALVGRNGSGKSTLLKMLAGIMPPHEGTIDIGGSVASMLELGSGFHPDFTGRENIFMNGAIHGLSERAVRDRLDDIVTFAELDDFIDMPVRTYSSGMQMRLAFAVAAHVNPDVLLLDEVLAVGDEAFQRKCISRIETFLHDGGTLIFVSHSADAVEQVCQRALLLDSGRLIADGPSEVVLLEYKRRVNEGRGHPGGEFATAELVRPGTTRDRSSGIRIASLRVTTPDGRSLPGSVLAGDVVSIETVVEVTEPAGALDLAIHLRNSRAQEVLAACSSEGSVRLPSEKGRFVCTALMALPLQEDTIEMSAVVRDQGSGEVFDHAFLPEGVRIERLHPGQGVLAVPVEWALDALNPTSNQGR